MTPNITIRSRGLLLVGLICAAVTARTLFDDVITTGAPLTVSHLQSAVALIAALVAGHMIMPTLKQRMLASLLGVCLIFISATGYCVIAAGSRNAEVAATKTSTVEASNEQRQAAEQKVAEALQAEAEAKATAQKAAEAAARECASGKGKRCQGRTETRDFAAKEYDKATGYRIMSEVQRDAMKPVIEVHAGYRHTAKIIEAFGIGSARDIEPRLELIMPFITVLISEVGTLVFLGMALGHTRTPIPANDINPKLIQTKSDNSGPVTPRPRPRRGRKSNKTVVDFTDAFRLKHGRAPTGSEIKSAFPNMPRSTCFDYAARANASPNVWRIA